MSKRRKTPNRKHKGPRAQPPRRLASISMSQNLIGATGHDKAFERFVDHCLEQHRSAAGEPDPHEPDSAISWHPIPDIYRTSPCLHPLPADGVVVATEWGDRWHITGVMFDYEFCQLNEEL